MLLRRMNPEFAQSCQLYLLLRGNSLDLCFLLFFFTLLEASSSTTFLSRKTTTLSASHSILRPTKQFFLCDFDCNFLHLDLDLTYHLTTALTHNVKWFVIPASDLNESIQLSKLKKEIPNIIGITSGVHPYRTQDVQLDLKSLSELESLIRSDEYCAVVCSFLHLLHHPMLAL
jgi:hypothetical protein